MRQTKGDSEQITLEDYRQRRAKYLAGLDRSFLLAEIHHDLQQFVNFGQPEIAGRARKLHRAVKTHPDPAQLTEQFTRLEVDFILHPKTRNLMTLPPFKGQASRRYGQGSASA